MAGRVGRVSERGRRAGRALALTFSVLALLFQINAPVHAAMMAMDGRDAAPICSVHQGHDSQRKAPPAQHEACAACAVCAVAGVGLVSTAFAPPIPTLAQVAAPRGPREIAPRGPPAFVPRARGPPAYA